MTNAPSTAVVLKDQAGDYYLLSEQMLKGTRIPEEYKAEVERLVEAAAQGGIAGDDVRGHNPVAAGVAAACILYTGFDIGYGLVKSWLGPEAQVPNLDLGASASPERIR